MSVELDFNLVRQGRVDEYLDRIEVAYGERFRGPEGAKHLRAIREIYIGETESPLRTAYMVRFFDVLTPEQQRAFMNESLRLDNARHAAMMDKERSTWPWWKKAWKWYRLTFR